MKKYTSLIALALSALIFTSCGTVSKVTPTTGVTAKSYSKVIVKNFNYKGAANEVNGPASSTIFSDHISNEIKKNGSFSSVSRSGKAGADTLVISGDVTRYVTGNAALRLLVGMGAGSSYFDADVHFTDGATGKSLASMKVDKNSWGLGGGLAAGQNPESFMQGSAKKVATEATKFSKNPPAQN
jgi:hypothetical protein